MALGPLWLAAMRFCRGSILQMNDATGFFFLGSIDSPTLPNCRPRAGLHLHTIEEFKITQSGRSFPLSPFDPQFSES
ncbi:hypothetical protein B0H63DRAFT_9194 [Podospora didyma]|uniref:Uncharacterized protein n=1 Tax=Podospora didyma TaxID=330526 RepID=A0AAE0U7A6_9PEZI|nr:hypothetical protein B0H63DRAFT_9194 [Podospora didyma]